MNRETLLFQRNFKTSMPFCLGENENTKHSLIHCTTLILLYTTTTTTSTTGTCSSSTSSNTSTTSNTSNTSNAWCTHTVVIESTWYM